jgi:hypothetical protein
MIEVKTPAEQFFDLDGSALDGGFIYVGASGANPETTPVAVYWDKDGTIPATQPIGTVNGYPYRLGAAAKFYTATKNYSITVRNSTGSLVISATNTDSGVFDELLTVSAAASIGYNNATSGLTADTVQEAVDELKTTADALDATVAGLDLGTTGVINLFANAAFMINQRGYVSGAATSGANQYTLDRIRVVVSGQNLAFSASTFGNKITAPAGGAEQVIEGRLITGGDYACTWVGTGTIQVNGVAQIKGDTFTLTAWSNATITLFGEIEQFMLTRPSMLKQFEYDYSRDLSLCFRYYESGGVVRGAPYVRPAGVSTTDPICFASVQFKVRKRTTPTMTGSPSFASINSWTDVGTSSAVASLLADNASGEAKVSAWQASAEI